MTNHESDSVTDEGHALSLGHWPLLFAPVVSLHFIGLPISAAHEHHQPQTR